MKQFSRTWNKIRACLEQDYISVLINVFGTLCVIISLFYVQAQINQSNKAFIATETREALHSLYDFEENISVRQYGFDTLFNLNDEFELDRLAFDGLSIKLENHQTVKLIKPSLESLELYLHGSVEFYGRGSIDDLRIKTISGRSIGNLKVSSINSTYRFNIKNFQRINFIRNFDLFGVHFSESDFQSSEICRLYALYSSFENTSFASATLGSCFSTGIHRIDSLFGRVSFVRSDFKDTNFHDARLLNVDFLHTDGLTQDDFRGACVGPQVRLPEGIVIEKRC